MIAGQQIDGDGESAQRIHGFGDDPAIYMVGVEDVADDDHEPASLVGGDLGYALDGGETILREAGAGLVGEEVSLHPEVPVRGMKKLVHIWELIW